MKTLKKITLIALVATLFVTCKKDQLPPTTVENQPVFTFNGTIYSNTVSWSAGVNNYYMYSSYSQNDTTGVLSFIGNLQNISNANNSIEFIINDYKTSALNTTSISAGHIDSALSTSVAYVYNKGNTVINDTTGYTVNFTSKIYSGSALSYKYSFGDGSTSSLPNPSHTYSYKGNYHTSLNIDFSHCNNVIDTNSFNISKDTTQLTIDSIHAVDSMRVGLNEIVKLSSAVAGGTPPYSYFWQFGDGNTSTLATPSHYYADSNSSQNTYLCTLTVTDHAHSTAIYNYVVQDSGETCRFDYNMSSPKPNIIVTNSQALSAITILYTNASGVQYTSKNASQSGSFSITSVSSYQNNVNGKPTEMLKVEFNNCSLYNSTANPPLIIASGTATIAVAYP
jgi:hypothetical protein